MKKLSQLEMIELFTIYRGETNRVIGTPRYSHLEKRGLIRWVDASPKLTEEGRIALKRTGMI